MKRKIFLRGAVRAIMYSPLFSLMRYIFTYNKPHLFHVYSSLISTNLSVTNIIDQFFIPNKIVPVLLFHSSYPHSTTNKPSQLLAYSINRVPWCDMPHLVCSSTGWLTCHHLWCRAIMNNFAVKFLCYSWCRHKILCFLCKYLRVNLLGHWAVLCLTFLRNCQTVFSK